MSICIPCKILEELHLHFSGVVLHLRHETVVSLQEQDRTYLSGVGAA